MKLNFNTFLYSAFFFTFILFGVFFLDDAKNSHNDFFKSLALGARASEEDKVDIQKSSVMATPLLVRQVLDKATSEIIVFARNSQDLPVVGAQVELTTTFGTFEQKTGMTDINGKSIFKLTSKEFGTAQVNAKVNALQLPNTLVIEFTE